ncbi:MAG: flagellar basal body-associated FliL family protein [Pseudomonadota bacterium]
MRRLIALSMALFAPLVLAAGGGDDESPSTYLELSPAFVVNVGNSDEGGGYAKAEVTLRFREAADREEAEAHVPWLRHEVVMVMSGQSAEELRTSDGQKQLRKAIREAVSERLLAEVPSLEKSPDEESEETEGDEKNEADDNGEESEPAGPVREVLLPNFIVQAR